MRRDDRRDDSYDHAIRNPRSRSSEPASPHELKARLNTVLAQRDEWQEKAEEAQKQHQTAIALYQDEQHKYQSTLALYETVQSEAQSYLTLYNEEKARWSELQVQYEQVQVERNHYITLYQEAQLQLKFERRSKAGIKGWETRRKRENERLKQEIAEMTVLLRDSLARKEEAIGHLEELADRMDRIQHLVNSVEEDSTATPMGLLQKFKRMWQAMKDILAE